MEGATRDVVVGIKFGLIATLAYAVLFSGIAWLFATIGASAANLSGISGDDFKYVNKSVFSWPFAAMVFLFFLSTNVLFAAVWKGGVQLRHWAPVIVLIIFPVVLLWISGLVIEYRRLGGTFPSSYLSGASLIAGLILLNYNNEEKGGNVLAFFLLAFVMLFLETSLDHFEEWSEKAEQLAKFSDPEPSAYVIPAVIRIGATWFVFIYLVEKMLSWRNEDKSKEVPEIEPEVLTAKRQSTPKSNTNSCEICGKQTDNNFGTTSVRLCKDCSGAA